VVRDEESTTGRDHVERGDDPAVPQVDGVGDVMAFDGRVDRPADDAVHEQRGDDGADRDERDHARTSGTRLEREYGDRHEHREHAEGDGQVQPGRRSPRRVRDLSAETPPDERLGQLMCGKDERQRREGSLPTAADVTPRIDAKGPDDHRGRHIGLRGEAHGATLVVDSLTRMAGPCRAAGGGASRAARGECADEAPS
jgi:hypothetical protein